MTENSRPADSSPEQVPLAVRRLRKLRARYPDATPATLAERLGGIFVRDFTLVGSAQAGAQELTPNVLGSVTRNRRVAGLTQAAAHLGAVQQGMATYSRAANKGINTTAHVGSAQAVKTYLHGMALLHGLHVESSDEAATAILGAEVNDILTQMQEAPRDGGATQQMNILGAVAAIGLRNPQTLLLVKAGEQLVKAGGAVFASQKMRRDFAQQIIAQVDQNLGAAPSQLPASTLTVLDSGQDAGSPVDGSGQGNGGSVPADDDADLLELSAEEVSAIEAPEPVAPSALEEPEPVKPSQIEAPEPVTASAIEDPAPVVTETQVRPSTEAELAAADGATARGARLAARAFVRARSRFRG
ncbi:hypothetical protein [Rothia nasimurium]|uniref:hypothetical protein n=1 Tax=Rothia nasimurium TaxID=85336 RepID=UPI001F182E55|nr:hypothetical protein [Rothia nasimurium]